MSSNNVWIGLLNLKSILTVAKKLPGNRASSQKLAKRGSVSSVGEGQGTRPQLAAYIGSSFWPPFVKRFALCYRTVVYPVCLRRWCTVAKRLDGSRWHLARR